MRSGRIVPRDQKSDSTPNKAISLARCVSLSAMACWTNTTLCIGPIDKLPPERFFARPSSNHLGATKTVSIDPIRSIAMNRKEPRMLSPTINAPTMTAAATPTPIATGTSSPRKCNSVLMTSDNMINPIDFARRLARYAAGTKYFVNSPALTSSHVMARHKTMAEFSLPCD